MMLCRDRLLGLNQFGMAAHIQLATLVCDSGLGFSEVESGFDRQRFRWELLPER